MSFDENETVAVSEVVPSEFRNVFKMQSFNVLQSAVVEQTLHTNLNMVVAAPTGTGKTAIHELAIVKLFSNNKNAKCVYVAPNKSLCQQKLAEWVVSFGQLGINVVEVTGDCDSSKTMQNIAKAAIIVTTPEKWDSITRFWRNHVYLLGCIDLLLLDEIHHISEDRGASLEIVVVRMRTLNDAYLRKVPANMSNNNTKMKMRVIALSATLPNVVDVGEWLQCVPEAIHLFDDSYRSVPLTVKTIAYGSAGNAFLFERGLDNHVTNVIQKYSEGKQTLIFVSSKKNTETLAALLSNKHLSISPDRMTFSAKINALQDPKLKSLMMLGMGYHHAGLPPDDRTIVEDLFLAGCVRVLVCTSTLAFGVNLPAHLVIIKGTNQWRGGSKGYERLPRSTVLQMIGRAGRPGFDTRGMAIIMTCNEDKPFFNPDTMQMEVVESTLQAILTEAICCEITQTVISDVAEAIAWLKNTYFYIRVRKNPRQYGFGNAKNEADLESLLREACITCIRDLAGAEIVQLDDVDKFVLSPNPEAGIMTRNMIRFNTMKLITNLSSSSTVEELLGHMCKAEELHKSLRRDDKKILNNMMKLVKYPWKCKVQEPFQKAYVLIQAAVGRLSLTEFSLKVEQSEIVEQSVRVLSAIRELSIEREKGKLLESSLLLQRSLLLRSWSNDRSVDSGGILTNCYGLSDTTKQTLREKGLFTVMDFERNKVKFESLGAIQLWCHCPVTEANILRSYFRHCRKYAEQVRVEYETKILGGKDEATLHYTVFPLVDDPLLISNFDNGQFLAETYHLVSYCELTSKLLCHRRISAMDVANRQSLSFSVCFSIDPGVGFDVNTTRTMLISNHTGMDYLTKSDGRGGSVSANDAAEESESAEGVGTSCGGGKSNQTATERAEKKKRASSKRRATTKQNQTNMPVDPMVSVLEAHPRTTHKQPSKQQSKGSTGTGDFNSFLDYFSLRNKSFTNFHDDMRKSITHAKEEEEDGDVCSTSSITGSNSRGIHGSPSSHVHTHPLGCPKHGHSARGGVGSNDPLIHVSGRVSRELREVDQDTVNYPGSSPSRKSSQLLSGQGSPLRKTNQASSGISGASYGGKETNRELYVLRQKATELGLYNHPISRQTPVNRFSNSMGGAACLFQVPREGGTEGCISHRQRAGGTEYHPEDTDKGTAFFTDNARSCSDSSNTSNSSVSKQFSPLSTLNLKRARFNPVSGAENSRYSTNNGSLFFDTPPMAGIAPISTFSGSDLGPHNITIGSSDNMLGQNPSQETAQHQQYCMNNRSMHEDLAGQSSDSGMKGSVLGGTRNRSLSVPSCGPVSSSIHKKDDMDVDGDMSVPRLCTTTDSTGQYYTPPKQHGVGGVSECMPYQLKEKALLPGARAAVPSGLSVKSDRDARFEASFF